MKKNCRLSKESTRARVCVYGGGVYVKDDPKSRCIVRFIFSSKVLQQIGVAYEDKDDRNTFHGLQCEYNRSSLPCPNSVSHLLPGGNKAAIQCKIRSREDSSLSLYFAFARPRIVYDAFRQFRRKKGSFTRFSTRLGLARSNFYQIINFAKNFHPGDTHATRVTIPIGRPVRIDANCGNSGTEIDNVRNSHFLACHYTFLP